MHTFKECPVLAWRAVFVAAFRKFLSVLRCQGTISNQKVLMEADRDGDGHLVLRRNQKGEIVDYMIP